MKWCKGYSLEYNDREGYISRCDGTKERDICSCGGDKSKCDFYENVRDEGRLEEKLKETIKKIDDKSFNLLEELYKIIDRSLKDSSVRSIEVVVKDFIQIKINRLKGE